MINPSLTVAICTTIFTISCASESPPPLAESTATHWFEQSASVDLARDSLPTITQATLALHSTDTGTVFSPRCTCAVTHLSYSLGIRTPKSIDTTKRYPLIIYLHGGNGSPLDNKGEQAWNMFSFIADSMQIFLASPSANRDAPWWSPAGQHRILAALRYMSLRYPIDPDRVFLAGVSDGATGCILAAEIIPGPFAGFIPVSGFGGMLMQMGLPIYPANLSSRPIYCINGGKDRLYNGDMVKDFLNQLHQTGVPVTLSFHPDEEHGFDYRETERKPITEAILNWRRPHPTAVVHTFLTGYPNAPDLIARVSKREAGVDAALSTEIINDTIRINQTNCKEVVFSLPDVNAPHWARIDAKVIKLKDITKTPQATATIWAHASFPRSENHRLLQVIIP